MCVTNGGATARSLDKVYPCVDTRVTRLREVAPPFVALTTALWKTTLPNKTEPRYLPGIDLRLNMSTPLHHVV